MSARTYLPTLYRIIKVVCEYTVRYDRQIREHLPPEAISAYDAYKTACDVFIVLIPLVEESF